ncbi:putative cyclase [Coniochaeta sp. PMI_546]|nr:putative cyclase [Coniochaeta sp. PMI_546]
MDLLRCLDQGFRIYDLAVSWENGMAASPSNVPFSMALTWRHGDRQMGGTKGGSASNSMVVTGDHVGTHIDALCHVSNNGVLHGGVDVTDACHGGRFQFHGVETISPMICRGILLDIPALKGVSRLEAGYGITDDDLQAALGDTPLNKGDVALIRTGWIQQYADAKAYLGNNTGVPGIAASGGQWLADHGVRAAGADTIGFDQVQLGPDFRKRPCHGILLWEHGIHIIEVMDLEELAEQKVKEFLFVLSPLKWKGATASPVRPLAVVNM